MADAAFPTPTVEQLTVIEACREAARRYSYGIDHLDAEVMKSAYWPDATDDHGRFVGNAWEFVDRVIHSHERYEWTMHVASNHRVEIDDDARARGEIYSVCYLFHGEARLLDTWYGRYLDVYERRGDEWRIAERVCVHHGSTRQSVPDDMQIDTTPFRQGSFDRPSSRRPIGP